VNSLLPTQNLGTDNELRVEQDSAINHSYLKFQVSGTRAIVHGAKLRLYVTNSSDDGGSIHKVSDYYAGTVTAWTENGLVWNNAPAIGPPALSSVSSPSAGTWVEFDVSAAIPGDGTYSFGLQSASDNSVEYSSKEGTRAPELVVATESSGANVTNSAPVAAANSYSTDQGVALNVAQPGLLDNDTDPNADPLAVTHATTPGNGALSFNADGSFTYTPNPAFAGLDQFTYYIVDGRGGIDSESVSITVNSTNQAPAGIDDDYSTPEDQPLVVNAPGVLANDSDPDGDPLTAALESSPSNGTATLNGNGSFTYTPEPDFFGVDTFTYQVSDGFGGSVRTFGPNWALRPRTSALVSPTAARAHSVT